MITFFKWLFSLFKVTGIGDIADSVIDDVKLTGKEKDAYLQAKSQYLSACMPFNVARRFIAICFSFLYLLLIAAVCITHYWSPDYSKFLSGIVRDDLSTSMNLIIGFYFAIGGVSKIGELLRK